MFSKRGRGENDKLTLILLNIYIHVIFLYFSLVFKKKEPGIIL